MMDLTYNHIMTNLRELLQLKNQKSLLLEIDNVEDMLEVAALVAEVMGFKTKAYIKMPLFDDRREVTSFLTDVIMHYPNEFNEKFGIVIDSNSYISDEANKTKVICGRTANE